MMTDSQHPTEAELAAYIDGVGNGRDKVAAHLAGCDECLATVGTAIRARDTLPADVPPAFLAAARARGPAVREASSRRALTVVLPGLAVAASLLLAVAIWQFPAPSDPAAVLAPQAVAEPPGPVRRDAAAARAVVISPAEEAVVTGTPLTIRWTAVPSAAFYTVRLTTDDGALVWQEDVTGVEAVVPAGVPLAAGRSYFVLLSPSLPGNRHMAPTTTKFSTPPVR